MPFKRMHKHVTAPKHVHCHHCISPLGRKLLLMTDPAIMSKNYSALWSSLRTLELINQFTLTPVELVKGYSTFFDNIKDKKHMWASGLAHIGATSSDAKTVTACSIEVMYPEVGDDPVVILRMAQNKQVDEEEKLKLVNDLVMEIASQEKRVWNTKGSVLSFISSRCQDLIVSVTRPIYHHLFYRQEGSSALYSTVMQRQDISYLNWALFSAFSWVVCKYW